MSSEHPSGKDVRVEPGTWTIEEAFRLMDEARAERDKAVEAARLLRDFSRHYDWCDFSRHCGYEYGDDYEALVRDHPCDCGAVAAFDAAEALGIDPGGDERTKQVLAWRAAQRDARAENARLRALLVRAREALGALDRGFALAERVVQTMKELLPPVPNADDVAGATYVKWQAFTNAVCDSDDHNDATGSLVDSTVADLDAALKVTP